jgi:hypothetical protein
VPKKKKKKGNKGKRKKDHVGKREGKVNLDSLFLVGLEFKLRPSHLQSRCSIT